MLQKNLKVDIINAAYAKLRISGLTVSPRPEERTIALRRLESFANEMKAHNACTGYNFEDIPDLNSNSGLDPALWDAFESILALRLQPDFGKGKNPDKELIKNAGAGLSTIYNIAYTPPTIAYPTRQPIGNGNALKFPTHREYFVNDEQISTDCTVNSMYVGDIDNFIERFDAYLLENETIASYTIEADTGLTLSNEANTDTDVTYTVTAAGTTSYANQNLKVKIVVTTSTGRKETRFAYFQLFSPEAIR
jgi:hypothetical protein